jgi:hypothetical protein
VKLNDYDPKKIKVKDARTMSEADKAGIEYGDMVERVQRRQRRKEENKRAADAAKRRIKNGGGGW